ncbi:MAG: condensation domain-containing protein, partial [Acidobacteria bacterium]|nr:condensation domain-containing protein [Acidobacteriota bacterium]
MQDKVIQGFRLSPQQRHLWQLQQPESLPYRVWGAVSIEGQLDLDALETAAREIVARHEILRTTFHQISGMNFPVQVIHDDCDPKIQRLDFNDLSDGERDPAVEALFHEASQLPFEFDSAPLLRLTVARLSAHEHLLIISLPALCADLTGLTVLVREIAHAYASSTEAGGDLEELMQYADVAEILNELLESGETAAGRDYWSGKSIEDSAFFKLPLAEYSGDKQRFEPRSLVSMIDPAIAAGIKESATGERVSLQEFLQVAWNILLHKLTARTQVTVGTAYAGRTYEGLDRVPGLFARFLPLSCHLEGDFKFRDVVAQVRQAAAEAHEWQEYFTWENDSPTRFDNGANPQFFPLGFEFIEQPAPLQLAGLRWAFARQEGYADRFDIKLRCLSMAEGHLRAELHYDGAQYSSENVERLSREYRRLLSSIVDNPSSAIDRLEILDEVERQTLLFDYNRTALNFPPPHSLHQLFEAQTARTPDAIALVSDKDHQQLSYSQLNTRANQLAHLLISSGVTPDARVALLFERSTDMLVTLIATLKAGAAYLP